MKVMIDTNVLISAALNPSGLASKSLYKALVLPFQPVVCDYIIDEMHKKFQEKFPNEIIQLEAFLYGMLQTIEIVKTPTKISSKEKFIRDIKDRPIIRAAISDNVDYLLTGDKDFLESSIKKPIIINPTNFIKLSI